MKSIQVDGGILKIVNGERVLINFNTYDRIQKVKKIVNRILNK